MLAFYGCIFAASRAFLSLRAWGRVAVEAFLCLLTLVTLLRVAEAIWLRAKHPSAIGVGSLILAVALAFAAVSVLAVVALHKPAVRDAFAAANAAREAQR
jgi:hypothetical protein